MKKTAQLYRMYTDHHICPFGIKALDLLKRKGYIVEDHLLKSREDTELFKAKHQVQTTPQVFIDKKRVGGYSDLLDYFGIPKKDKNKKSYAPIIAVFAVTLGLALAVSWLLTQSFPTLKVLELFVAISMSVLAILKLRDLDSFSNQFITYDILGKRAVKYSYVYPFIEAAAGISMVAKVGLFIFSPLAFIIGCIGTVSVIKAVYVEGRDLKCACVGGDSNVPLGFLSLTENLMMMFMGVWMLRDLSL